MKSFREFFLGVKNRAAAMVPVQVNGKFLGRIDRAVADLLMNDRNNFDLVAVPGKLINFVRETPEAWVILDVPLLDKRFKVMVSRMSYKGMPQYRLHSSAGVPMSPVFLDPESLARWCEDVFTDTFGFHISEALAKADLWGGGKPQ